MKTIQEITLLLEIKADVIKVKNKTLLHLQMKWKAKVVGNYKPIKPPVTLFYRKNKNRGKIAFTAVQPTT